MLRYAACNAAPCGASRSRCQAQAEWLRHSHQGPGAQAFLGHLAGVCSQKGSLLVLSQLEVGIATIEEHLTLLPFLPYEACGRTACDSPYQRAGSRARSRGIVGLCLSIEKPCIDTSTVTDPGLKSCCEVGSSIGVPAG